MTVWIVLKQGYPHRVFQSSEQARAFAAGKWFDIIEMAVEEEESDG